MNIQVLIDAIVRQTTVLIAQLATSGGARAPLAHLADQVFLDLVSELEHQGVSRKIGADMFGLALRTYQRKISRLSESATDRGRSLWEAVLSFLQERPVTTRAQVLRRFHRDDGTLVRGVLRDLTESGLLFASGRGESLAYRVASDSDLAHVQGDGAPNEEGLDALLWVHIYRDGPISNDELGRRVTVDGALFQRALERLVASGRVTKSESAGRVTYQSTELVVPLGASAGWEAAVFDHFQALVKTICCKLRLDSSASVRDLVGGSTYTFVVWSGHPLEDEVTSELGLYRKRASELRRRVDEHNREQGIPARHRKVISYAGQCVIDEEGDDTDD